VSSRALATSEGFLFLTRIDQLLRQLLWRVWMPGGDERLLRDPRIHQSANCVDSATVKFHNIAVSFSSCGTILNSVQIFHGTHSRHEGLPPGQYRAAHFMATRLHRPHPFIYKPACLCCLEFPSRLCVTPSFNQMISLDI
jgi:hypothetical protein